MAPTCIKNTKYVRTRCFLLAEPVLNTKAPAGIVPIQGAMDARDAAGPALQAPRALHLHVPRLPIDSIELRWTYVEAVLLLTSFADLLIDDDVRLLIDLKDIKP